MFHDQWKKENNECRIYPSSQFPWNRHSKVRDIFVFKQLQKFFFCYGKQTISSLLRYSSLFHKEQTTVVRVVTGPLKGCRRRYCLKAIVRVRTIVLRVRVRVKMLISPSPLGLQLGLKTFLLNVQEENGGIAQSAERSLCKREVQRSKLCASKKIFYWLYQDLNLESPDP